MLCDNQKASYISILLFRNDGVTDSLKVCELHNHCGTRPYLIVLNSISVVSDLHNSSSDMITRCPKLFIIGTIIILNI